MDGVREGGVGIKAHGIIEGQDTVMLFQLFNEREIQLRKPHSAGEQRESCFSLAAQKIAKWYSLNINILEAVSCLKRRYIRSKCSHRSFILPF